MNGGSFEVNNVGLVGIIDDSIGMVIQNVLLLKLCEPNPHNTTLQEHISSSGVYLFSCRARQPCRRMCGFRTQATPHSARKQPRWVPTRFLSLWSLSQRPYLLWHGYGSQLLEMFFGSPSTLRRPSTDLIFVTRGIFVFYIFDWGRTFPFHSLKSCVGKTEV